MTAVHAQWYFMRGAQQAGPFDEAYARQLAEAGHVLPTDKARRGHFQAWEAAGGLPALFPPRSPAAEPGKYRSLAGLASAIRFLLYVGIVLAAASILANMLHHNLAADEKAGLLADNALRDSWRLNIERQLVVGVLRGLIQLATAILFFVFLYRASKNCQALGARDMHFGPLGAVLWYFVPFAHLFVPCHALIEITAASSNPEDWQHEEEQDALLPIWWIFYVASWGAALYSAARFRAAKTPDEFMALTPTLTIANLVYIAWLAAGVILVKRIAACQDASRRRLF